MTAATFDGIELAQARNNVEAAQRWHQLVLDTQQGVRRDGQEALAIIDAAGKSIADLHAEVKRLREIEALQAELRTLRADRPNYRKFGMELELEHKEFAQATALHEKRVVELTAKLNGAASKRQRADDVVTKLKNLGVQCSESVVQALEKEINRLKGAHQRSLQEIGRANDFLEGRKQNLASVKRTLDTLVSSDDRKRALQREYDQDSAGIERESKELEGRRNSAAEHLTTIAEREAELKAIRERLLVDPNAEI